MGDRYRLAKAMGREEYERVVDADEALLESLGARLISVSGGVRIVVEKELRGDKKIHPWNVISVDAKAWEWLHPLLVELECRRVSGTRMAAN